MLLICKSLLLIRAFSRHRKPDVLKTGATKTDTGELEGPIALAIARLAYSIFGKQTKASDYPAFMEAASSEHSGNPVARDWITITLQLGDARRISRLSLRILHMEAGKKDSGAKSTGCLHDTRKLCKLMKDAHDAIREKTTTNFREEVVTFGSRISTSSATVYTFHRLTGRFYQAIPEIDGQKSVDYDEIILRKATRIEPEILHGGHYNCGAMQEVLTGGGNSWRGYLDDTISKQ
ncbi:MAG: hypothetical protein J3Q66DRAFT_445012 [Benniella sp.]|nr:MAG: hypothetical protein J3Q66DRAFT_445012 [Benniella sp.]